MAGSGGKNRNESGFEAILEKHSLKKTELRKNILKVLSLAETSLSQAELIEKLGRLLGTVDRVSIYRNLNQLKQAGVIHEVDANTYIYCEHECESHAHLLLYCQQCHKHREVKDHGRIESFMDSLGGLRFFGRGNPIFLRGVCSSCSAS